MGSSLSCRRAGAVLGSARHDVVERDVDRPRPVRSSARAAGMGSTESQSTGSRTCTSAGSTAASPASPRAGSAVHWTVTAPLVKPGAEGDHRDVVADLHPALVDRLGERDRHRAAEVLPYRSRLTKIRSIGRSRPFATASMIRMLAWCGMNRSMSSGVRPDRRSTPGPWSPSSSSRTDTWRCPPSGRSARRGRWCRRRAVPSPRRPGARSCRPPAGRSSARCRAPHRARRSRSGRPPRPRRRRGCTCFGRCSRGSGSAAPRR